MVRALTTIFGQTQCERFVSARGIIWKTSEFVVDGEGSESPYHEWRLLLTLVRDDSRRVYGLQETDLGDFERDDDQTEPPTHLVALADGAGLDEVEVLRTLLAMREENCGRPVEFVRRTSDLWDNATSF